MGKRNTPAVEAEETVVEEVAEEETVSEPAVAVGKNSSRTEVTVVYRLGTRTYTKAVHGDEFVDLAKQFAAKHDGKIV